MKNKILPVSIIILFIIFFIIFYKGLKNSNVYIPRNIIDKDIPKFEAKIFNSKNRMKSINIFKSNKFYLVNIWASWCIPCRDEHPFLMNLSKENNLEMIGLNYKDNIVNANNFLEQLKNPYRKILIDLDGTLAIEWGAYGVPESFLIKNGKIIKKVIGPLNEKSLMEIKDLIK
tara:strand:- start:870 stop:1388 length:519 start_codon:yes stop_codon:yes gene_type:complete